MLAQLGTDEHELGGDGVGYRGAHAPSFRHSGPHTLNVALRARKRETPASCCRRKRAPQMPGGSEGEIRHTHVHADAPLGHDPEGGFPLGTVRYHGRPGEVAEWLKAAPC